MLKVRFWTEAEDELLLTLTGDDRIVSDELLGRLLGRSKRSIQLRRHRLKHLQAVRQDAAQRRRQSGVRHPKQSQWQTEFYERGRLHATVIGEPWTEEEDARILAADRPGDTEIARELGRTVKAIHARRYFLRRKGRQCPSRQPPAFAIELPQAA